MNCRVPHFSRGVCARSWDFDFLKQIRNRAGNFDFPGKRKGPAPIPVKQIREPNAGLVSLTMTCLGYLVFMISDNLAR
jgi:hypothetical protein